MTGRNASAWVDWGWQGIVSSSVCGVHDDARTPVVGSAQELSCLPAGCLLGQRHTVQGNGTAAKVQVCQAALTWLAF